MAVADVNYNRAVPITLSNTVNFDGTTTGTGAYGTTTNTKPIPCQALAFGASGNAVVVFEDGSTATMAVLAGQVTPLKAIRINSTNTTTTGCTALYTV